MKRIFIICTHYFDFRNNRVTVGGIQTYITDLIPICIKLNLFPIIVSANDCDKRLEFSGYAIQGYGETGNNIPEALIRRTYYDMDLDNDVVLFATDNIISTKYVFKKSIAIQHGISWDIPRSGKRPLWRILLGRARESYRIQKRIDKVDKVVCVDYNFVNWYRTQCDNSGNKFVTITNYARVYEEPIKNNEVIRIIFARRLCWYRGTEVFLEAIKTILSEYKGIKVTIAGEGPDEDKMRNKLSSFSNVEFIKYDANESYTVHSAMDIAVIPTVGSEGTSLSLLEAMGAKCAVVCSDVGGMTNVVLNNFNGLIVEAGNAGKLYEGIKKLIDNKDLREYLSKNAYETVKSSFNHSRWADEWTRVLKEFT